MGDDAGYQIGKHIYAMLMDEYGASEGGVDLWNLSGGWSHKSLTRTHIAWQPLCTRPDVIRLWGSLAFVDE